MTDKNITHLIESVDTIDIGKSAIEPTVNADTGVKSFGYKDPDGNARRCLTTDKLDVLALKSEIGNAATIQGVPVSEDVPAYVALKNWLLVLWYYTNMYLWSSDIAQGAWLKTAAVTTLGTDGFVTPAALGNYRLYQSSTHEIGDTVYNSFKIKKGINDWIVAQVENSSKVVGFDLVNGVAGGTITAGVNYSIADDGEGYWEIKTDTVSAISGARNLNIYASDNGVTTSTTGDGANPAYYIKELQNSSNVTVADNLPHIPTTTVPVSAPAYVYEEKSVSNKLVNAATEAVETPAKNTLYIAPEPYQTQGGDDTVYAQLISGTGYTGTVTETIHGGGSVDKVIAIEGGCYDLTNTAWLANGYYVSSSFYVSSKIVTTTLNIERGASMDDTGDDTHMWFYFTLV